MAADSSLVEGAYKASRYVDMGKRRAQGELAKTLGGIDKGKPGDTSTTKPNKNLKKESKKKGKVEEKVDEKKSKELSPEWKNRLH